MKPVRLIKTIRIKDDADGYIVINETDYIPGQHELWVEGAPSKKKKEPEKKEADKALEDMDQDELIEYARTNFYVQFNKARSKESMIKEINSLREKYGD